MLLNIALILRMQKNKKVWDKITNRWNLVDCDDKIQISLYY